MIDKLLGEVHWEELEELLKSFTKEMSLKEDHVFGVEDNNLNSFLPYLVIDLIEHKFPLTKNRFVNSWSCPLYYDDFVKDTGVTLKDILDSQNKEVLGDVKDVLIRCLIFSILEIQPLASDTYKKVKLRFEHLNHEENLNEIYELIKKVHNGEKI